MFKTLLKDKADSKKDKPKEKAADPREAEKKGPAPADASKDVAFARRSVHRKDEKERSPEPSSGSARSSNDGPPVALETIQNKHLGAMLVHKERQNSSRFLVSAAQALEKLPLLKDTKAADRPDLFLRKIRQCTVVFDFEDALSHLKSKEIKRACLMELYDYIKANHNILTEAAHFEIVTMFQANACRVLSPASRINGADFDPEEDDPVLEPSWGHLQLVYELFGAFLESPEFQPNFAKKNMDTQFVSKLLDLFDSEDPRERDLLKTILHRVYGKMLALRVHIRRMINNIFFKFVYEPPGKHNGIAELLEILGSVINGFALPLKEEHKVFLLRVLVPLHKAKSLGPYHPQLAYCIVQFLEKDRSLAGPVLRGLFNMWPRTNSSKEVMLLNELEEIIDMMQPNDFESLRHDFFHQLARCISSKHFQVAERALYFWNNDHVLQMIQEFSSESIPILFPALSRNMKAHWNRTIHNLMLAAMRALIEIDAEVFEQCSAQFRLEIAQDKARSDQREAVWRQLESLASRNPASLVVPVARNSKAKPSADFSPVENLEDAVAELKRVRIETEPQPSRMRRKSILPQDQDVQQALMAHVPHGVGIYSGSD
eukprot:m.239583 g.239583  ORF g.239583 m.239583 type:complete len:602 (+) comp13499_c0_seq1:51-1856(+)